MKPSTTTSESASERRWTAIVPTIGRSPWLRDCLEALRLDGGEDLELWVVDQGEKASEAAAELADRVLRLEGNIGFARANNLALEQVETPFVALVNDDAVVTPGWSRALLDRLTATPDLAAVQGVQWKMDPERVDSTAEDAFTVDGCGLGWNRHWQAVQLGHGEPWGVWRTSFFDGPSGEDGWVEVFGVSATAAMWRRSALDRLRFPSGAIFEPRLVSYYEDVDLACRSRAAGWLAGCAPAARAFHAGSATGRELPMASYHLIYGNRHLVLARFLGRAFWWHLPRAVLRDMVDLWHAWRRGDRTRRRAIPRGWWRAIRLAPGFVRFGPPMVRDLTAIRFR